MNSELEITGFHENTIEDWMKKAESQVIEEKWLGTPEELDMSVEMHIVDGIDSPYAMNKNRLMPYLENLHVLAAFRDISMEELYQKASKKENRIALSEIHRNYEKSPWDLQELITRKVDAISPETSVYCFSQPITLDGLEENISQVEQIEQNINSSNSYCLYGLELSSYGDGESPIGVFNTLEERSELVIHFGYRGTEDLMNTYNQIMEDYDLPKRSGIPSQIHLGSGEPYITMDSEEEVKVDKERIEKEILPI